MRTIQGLDEEPERNEKSRGMRRKERCSELRDEESRSRDEESREMRRVER